MDAVIPAAGKASRIRGLPKFLLPCDREYQTLIEWHIAHLRQICDRVFIGCRPEQANLLRSLGLAGEQIVLCEVESPTMTSTVAKLLTHSDSESFVLAMPDTYFFGGQLSYRRFLEEAAGSRGSFFHLGLWNIRESQVGRVGQISLRSDGRVLDSVDKSPESNYPYLWGVMAFSRDVFDGFMKPEDPHTGYGIPRAVSEGLAVTTRLFEGEYFDCGTPSEYWDLLEKIH